MKSLKFFFLTQFFFQITSLFVPKNTEDAKLKNQIIELKNQLEQVSQADEFAKYSKIERKILQLRQMLDAKNKDYSALKSQTSSAFYKCWRILAVSVFCFFFHF